MHFTKGLRPGESWLIRRSAEAGTQDSWLPSAECPEWRCDDYQDALHGGVRRYPQEVLGRAWLSHTSVQHLPGSFLFNADSSAGRNGQAAMWIQLIALRGCSEHPPPPARRFLGLRERCLSPVSFPGLCPSQMLLVRPEPGKHAKVSSCC